LAYRAGAYTALMILGKTESKNTTLTVEAVTHVGQ